MVFWKSFKNKFELQLIVTYYFHDFFLFYFSLSFYSIFYFFSIKIQKIAEGRLIILFSYNKTADIAHILFQKLSCISALCIYDEKEYSIFQLSNLLLEGNEFQTQSFLKILALIRLHKSISATFRI